ncbi:MAG: DUF4388 domain-containing protein [Candidatus Cryosericum sp.]|nr:DUF4388 domain-containing protein [Candidatus Cryosericum sp.]HPS69934.1 DUF4388 domain-containing protein [Candidatus Cryosericum sp.]
MLEGKFSNSQVDEVLQTVIQGKATGRLNLEGSSIFGGRVQASVFIEDAHLVHVETAPGTTMSSLIDLFSLREGTFSFAGGETTAAKELSVPVADIILQVTAALDEWNSMHERLGSLDAVYALRAEGASGELQLTRQQWQVMAGLDGTTSLRELARRTGQGSVEVSKTVVGFMQSGLVREVETQPAPAEEEAERPARRGFLSLWGRK